MNDKVSVIIPYFRNIRYIDQSISSAINQTYKNWELIFYDNCSKDSSVFTVKNYKDKRIKCFYSKKFLNLGLARKKALSKAKGEFITFLDTDDIWKKNKLKEQLKAFHDSKVGFVISNS